MGTDNKSPSYLEDRERARGFFSNTKEGRHAVDVMVQQDGKKAVSALLDDDKWAEWEDLVSEHRGDLAIATSCQELRGAFELARKSNTLNKPPMGAEGRWLKFFSPPLWYVLRRQVEVDDPDFWNDPVNVMREALDNPQWAVAPADYIRGELLKHMGATNA